MSISTIKDSSSSTTQTKAKVLIIDDDEDINNLFKIFLESDGCCQVDSYTNPIDALYYFKQDKYDLVLLYLKNATDRWHYNISKFKKTDKNVTICLVTADLSYLEQLKEKTANIEKYAIHKPILLRNLKDIIHELFWKKVVCVIDLKIFHDYNFCSMISYFIN